MNVQFPKILSGAMACLALAATAFWPLAAAAGADDPDLIFRKSTTFKLLTPNDKIGTYAIDDVLLSAAGKQCRRDERQLQHRFRDNSRDNPTGTRGNGGNERHPDVVHSQLEYVGRSDGVLFRCGDRHELLRDPAGFQ